MQFFVPLFLLSIGAIATPAPPVLAAALSAPDASSNSDVSFTEEEWLAHAASKGIKVLNGTEYAAYQARSLTKREECVNGWTCGGGCGCTGIPCTRYVVSNSNVQEPISEILFLVQIYIDVITDWRYNRFWFCPAEYTTACGTCVDLCYYK